MIILKGTDEDGPVYILGMAEPDVLPRLRKGEGLTIEMSQLGLEGTLFIFMGPSDEELAKRLRKMIAASQATPPRGDSP